MRFSHFNNVPLVSAGPHISDPIQFFVLNLKREVSWVPQGAAKMPILGETRTPASLEPQNFTKNGKNFADCGSRTSQNWLEVEQHTVAPQCLGNFTMCGNKYIYT